LNLTDVVEVCVAELTVMGEYRGGLLCGLRERSSIQGNGSRLPGRYRNREVSVQGKI
jgi:hypothetical protein